MARNFVIAFGGTGVRCAEALAYLCASRSIREPVHILLVDPDASNGNVDLAHTQLQRYYALQGQVNHDAKGSAFFSTPLNPTEGPESFLWEYPNQHQQFSTLIDYTSQHPSHQQLLQLLYDQDDLDLSFEKGYIGRAHIGSLDLLRTLKRALENAAAEKEGEESNNADPLRIFFRALRSSAQGKDETRLLVYGSVFGGTGASGLPTVPPLIQQVLPKLHDRVRIGCVQVAPYFSFPEGQSRDPDSALHPLATQAALYHYAFASSGYHRIYLVGAPDRMETNTENRPGGIDQRNRAHYVELGAALAGAHFFQTPPAAVPSSEVFASGAREAVWAALPHGREAQVRRNLVSFATFCALHTHFLFDDLRAGKHRGAKWTHDLAAVTGRTLGGQETELEQLRDFARRFLQWADQVQHTADERLFNLPERPSAGQLAELSGGGQVDGDAYHRIIARLNRLGRVNQPTATGWYIDALSRSVDGFCSDNYASWWRGQ
jgi:hypothetical protein